MGDGSTTRNSLRVEGNEDIRHIENSVAEDPAGATVAFKASRPTVLTYGNPLDGSPVTNNLLAGEWFLLISVGDTDADGEPTYHGRDNRMALSEPVTFP